MAQNDDADIVVKITVKPGKHPGLVHFTYDPSTFMCKRGDTIKWKCQQGAFAIHFGERALLGRVVIRSEEQGAPWSTPSFTIGKNSFAADLSLQPGMYKYSVAVNVTQPNGDLPPGLYIDSCPGGGYDC